MIKVCIIGVSGFGNVHYETLLSEHAAGNVDIAGATIINQDEETEKCDHLRELGCRIFSDYNEMLKYLSGKAELCIIPTGIPLHRPMTVAAVEAGMHVLVEKPAAGCIQDVHSMRQAANRANKAVAVAYQHLYAPTTLETKRAILNGLVGDIAVIKCQARKPRDNRYYNRNNWAGRLQIADTWVLDSPLNNAMAHQLMMMLFLAGPSERQAAIPISVEAELYRANEIESADTVCVRVRTSTSATVLFYATHACNDNREPEIYVRGTRGRILWTQHGLIIEPDAGSKQELRTDMNDLRKCMMYSVYDMVRGGPAFYCDLALASLQTIVVNAAHEACAIHTLKGQTLLENDGSARTVIPGIDEVMENAFQEEKLFHESDVPWAQPAGCLSCDDYQEFKINHRLN
ncbi:MAG: Gfo/Idh/MocA family oxidoreductase [Planctomycetota bacterium]